MTSRVFGVAAILLAVAACSASDEAALIRGAELLMPFKSDLKQALQNGMQEGPIDAISACRIKAPEIAATLSVDGVRVGRSSHRLRNPANVGPDWVTPILESFVADPAARVAQVADLGGGRVGYIEPIMIQPVCLVCHGEALAPELESTLAELYPDDEATGFDEGDLRGVFWAEFPK